MYEKSKKITLVQTGTSGSDGFGTGIDNGICRGAFFFCESCGKSR